MNSLILHSTSLAQWYTLVNEAEGRVGTYLETDLESYLVHTLERYTNKPDLTGSILALDFLNGLKTTGKLRAEKLREVGDKCLLFSGFFPEVATKRLVTVSYFVELGRACYNFLSDVRDIGTLTTKLYALLRKHFIKLLDLLFSIRELSGEQQALTVIQAEDLWRHTGSQYAFSVLQKHKAINAKQLHFRTH